ncbi:MAG: hypothetical protein ACT4P7_11265 [Gemmatimonadaceae bacterium]
MIRTIMDLDPSDLEQALRRVGELLDAVDEHYAIVILGGAALNLLGIVPRPTTDVDILAFARPATPVPIGMREPPDPLPTGLVRAARIVARDMALDENWLNAGAALQWRAGLPPGLEGRVHWRRFAALWVGVVARHDLIFFKLFAAADSTGPASVHYRDLLALAPSSTELDQAAAWVATQDASPDFPTVLRTVVDHVRSDLGLDDGASRRRPR